MPGIDVRIDGRKVVRPPAVVEPGLLVDEVPVEPEESPDGPPEQPDADE